MKEILHGLTVPGTVATDALYLRPAASREVLTTLGLPHMPSTVEITQEATEDPFFGGPDVVGRLTEDVVECLALLGCGCAPCERHYLDAEHGSRGCPLRASALAAHLRKISPELHDLLFTDEDEADIPREDTVHPCWRSRRSMLVSARPRDPVRLDCPLCGKHEVTLAGTPTCSSCGPLRCGSCDGWLVWADQPSGRRPICNDPVCRQSPLASSDVDTEDDELFDFERLAEEDERAADMTKRFRLASHPRDRR